MSRNSRTKNEQNIKQANEQHQNGQSDAKNSPRGDKNIKFPFWADATIWHVVVIWSASSCARIWWDFPNKSNDDDFVSAWKWDGVNCNIIQICHFLASNVARFKFPLHRMTSESALGRQKFNFPCENNLRKNQHESSSSNLQRLLHSRRQCRVHFPSGQRRQAKKKLMIYVDSVVLSTTAS